MRDFATAAVEHTLRFPKWPMGCGPCVEAKPESSRPCHSFLGGPPCGWLGVPPPVYRAIGIYSTWGAFAADFGGWDSVLSGEESDEVERTRLRRLIATIHRVAREHREKSEKAPA